MLHIKFQGYDAFWDSADFKWSCSRPDIKELLDRLTLEEEWFDKYTPLREGSYERVVLDALWVQLDFDLISIKPTPPPEEEPGIDQ